MNRPCADPIAGPVLADYWIGELRQPDQEIVEEHLLGCDDCCARLREVTALANGIRSVARQGDLQFILSETFLEAASKQGLRVREYAPHNGGSVECTVTAADDLLVARLAADLGGARRVDVVLCDAAGSEWFRLRDIPFNPARKEVVFNQPIGFAKASGPDVLVVKLLALEEDGERILGQYRFNHTPS